MTCIFLTYVAWHCAEDKRTDTGDRSETSDDDNSQDAGKTDDAGLQPAYLLATNVTTPAGSNIYLNVLSSPTNQRVDVSKGLEISGSGAAFSELGYVFVASNDTLTLTRYEVKDDRLVAPRVLSFGGFGLSYLRDFYVFSATRGYVVQPQEGLLVVWNPTTMELVEDVPLIDLKRNGFDGGISANGRDVSYGHRLLAKQAGVLALPISWYADDTLTWEPGIGMFTVSATDASDQQLEISPCSTLPVTSTSGRDGKLYTLSSASWGAWAKFGPAQAPSSAFSRFDLNSGSFEDYCQDIPSLTQGDEGGLLLQYAPGKFLLKVIDDELITYGDAQSYWADIEFGCRFFNGDIDESGNLSLSEQPAMGTQANGCFGGVYTIDEEPYFYYQAPNIAGGILQRWNGAELVSEVEVSDGYVVAFERIR